MTVIIGRRELLAALGGAGDPGGQYQARVRLIHARRVQQPYGPSIFKAASVTLAVSREKGRGIALGLCRRGRTSALLDES
jgi:hypothetical protein